MSHTAQPFLFCKESISVCIEAAFSLMITRFSINSFVYVSAVFLALSLSSVQILMILLESILMPRNFLIPIAVILAASLEHRSHLFSVL